MTFSAKVKNELCRVRVDKKHCAIAEAYGILLFCNTFSYKEIRIITSSTAFVNRVQKVFREAFEIEFDKLPGDIKGKKTLLITAEDKIRRVFEAFGYSPDNYLALHINLPIIELDCCRNSFMRGAFLAGGAVSEPEKRYHLELITAHYNVNKEIYSVLSEMGFRPKEAVRSGNRMIYFKQSEYIEDFLTTIGAPIAAMDIMSAKVEKGLRNSINRRVNCETANLDRTVNAAQEQIQTIRSIGISSLPENLRETAQMRIDNPEMSLSELASMFDPPMTKSGLNHRLRKIMEIAKEDKGEK